MLGYAKQALQLWQTELVSLLSNAGLKETVRFVDGRGANFYRLSVDFAVVVWNVVSCYSIIVDGPNT